MTRKNIWITLLVLLCGHVCAQNGRYYETRLFTRELKTLRVQYAPEVLGTEVGQANNSPMRPYLVLSDDMPADGQQVEISFDEMSHNTRMFSYTVLHLNADWTQDDLVSTDYLRGFTTADITDYQHSFNTQQLYTHYRFTFPNDDMCPLVSGNYAIVIYEDGRKEQPLATVCLRIVEPKVKVTSNLRSNTDIELSGRYQQLDIDVQTAGLKVTSPDEVRLVVEQNGRRDNCVFAPKPTYVEPGKLRWQNCKALIFEGGVEYQHFDISSVYFMGQNVDHIHFDHTYYHAFLFPSEVRAEQPYISEPDANGQYVINAERTDQDDTEAEYMLVHFILPAERPWFDGTVYLLGDAWYNRFTEENRLQYDEEHHAYVGSCYMKQGGYEWQYAFWPKGARKATLQRVEGSHWQTGNQYRIMVYYRPLGGRYDRLVYMSE